MRIIPMDILSIMSIIVTILPIMPTILKKIKSCCNTSKPTYNISINHDGSINKAEIIKVDLLQMLEKEWYTNGHHHRWNHLYIPDSYNEYIEYKEQDNYDKILESKLII